MCSLVELNDKLTSLRSQRDSVENRLVDSITSRERLLELLNYVQSMKVLVLNPPSAPSQHLSANKAPSLQKTMEVYNQYRDRVYASTSTPAVSISKRFSGSPFSAQKENDGGIHEPLKDAQLFVRDMMAQTHDPVSDTDVDELYAVGRRIDSCGVFISDETVGQSVEEAAAVVTDSQNHAGYTAVIPVVIESANTSSVLNRRLGKFNLGQPPDELLEDFDRVIRHLEEIWKSELGSFEAVEKLAQVLVLREQTWRRICILHAEVRRFFRKHSP